VTLSEFDTLVSGDTVVFHSRWLGREVTGEVRVESADTIKIKWDDGLVMTIRRDEVQTHGMFYTPFKVKYRG
jgi:hypothetical protein